jgi:NAD(P)-dependent dehydrogenase (short-subunit alcohol dehydrogenase family)
VTRPLDGRVAAITGGSRGIGYAIAEAFLDAGATVVIGDLVADRTAEAVARLAEKGPASGVALDVRDWGSVAAFFDGIRDEHGQLDVAVNNAGIQEAGPSLEMSEQRWSDVIAVNLTGVFACAQAAGRVMAAQGSGSIINMSSGAAVRGLPERAPYCSAKAGVSSLTRVLGTEWAGLGIRVNAIGPGWVETDFVREVVDLGRLDLTSVRERTPMYFTGQTLFPDGGFTAGG